jgi:DNA-binding transcriptional MerR regulator
MRVIDNDIASQGARDANAGVEKFYSVTELARELEVSTRTLRFYEDRGLITPQRAGNARIYSRRDRARMILILRGKRVGFTLREIKEFLDLYDFDGGHSEQLRVLAVAVEERIAHLQSQRQALDETLAELADIRNQALLALENQKSSRA